LAGNGTIGSENGTGSEARFSSPQGIAVDAEGNVYVADQNNHKIRKITKEGVVTTFAGSGSQGATNGTGTAASFRNPGGVAVKTLILYRELNYLNPKSQNTFLNRILSK